MQRTFKESLNTYITLPGFAYRPPERVRLDIMKISEKIEELTEKINIRELLMDMIAEGARHEPQRWLAELKELAEETNESLEKLRRLGGLLDGLLYECREVKCRLGI